MPTKAITRCKTLSKGWNEKISNKQIMVRHTRQMTLQNRVSTLLQREHCFIPLWYFATMRCQRMNRRVIDQGMRDFEYIGNYRALILVAKLDDAIYLLNPTTNQRFTILEDRIGFPPRTNSSSVLFSIGYNPNHEDYQVVRLSLFHVLDKKTEMKIYSRNTNEWKDYGEFPDYRFVTNPGVYANYSVHWLLLSDNIVAFSLVNESFYFINLPPEVNRTYRHYSFSTINGEKLVIIPTFYMGDEPIFLWMLDDYSDDTSWSKHTAFPDFPIRNAFRFINFQPLYLVEPHRKKIMFCINPFTTFWSWDFKEQRFEAMAGEPIINDASTTFTVVEGLW